ncbi:hypothetical protein MIND_00520400 [Mycena indigotica]|uniref:ATP synthase protein MI25 n=1 Tax=Mycena indigotica TaxID=2126181 RepID=A0A8H6SYS9_9AGAR|nr:uncharacterized protein MIND_00520400 [Mycena indigotica]KAF7307267.1 hypothetical protein MIND_00520400 [Mycena indigotica]
MFSLFGLLLHEGPHQRHASRQPRESQIRALSPKGIFCLIYEPSVSINARCNRTQPGMAHLLRSLLDLVSSEDNFLVQYLILVGVLFCATGLFAQRLLPHKCISDLERMINDAKDAFDRGQEEHLLRDRTVRQKFKQRLSSIQARKAILRSEVLVTYGLSCSARGYFYLFGALAREVRSCQKDVQSLHLVILKEIEEQLKVMHLEEADDLRAILASSSSAGT